MSGSPGRNKGAIEDRIEKGSATSADKVGGRCVDRCNCGFSYGLAPLITVFVAVQDKLNSIRFKYGNGILANPKRVDVILVGSRAIWRMVEINHPPELTRGT